MKKTQPETFTLDRIASPVGEVLLVTDAEGAVRAFDFTDYEARMMKLLARHYGEVALAEGRAPEAVRAAVAAYFGGDAKALDGLTVKTGGTDFQRQVWAALRTIPAGETWSYGQLANAIGKPAAVRAVGLGNTAGFRYAVGLANGAKPIGVIVPCHRVVGANGTLTGYAGGLERKRWLLAHESAASRLI